MPKQLQEQLPGSSIELTPTYLQLLLVLGQDSVIGTQQSSVHSLAGEAMTELQNVMVVQLISQCHCIDVVMPFLLCEEEE